MIEELKTFLVKCQGDGCTESQKYTAPSHDEAILIAEADGWKSRVSPYLFCRACEKTAVAEYEKDHGPLDQVK